MLVVDLNYYLCYLTKARMVADIMHSGTMFRSVPRRQIR